MKLRWSAQSLHDLEAIVSYIAEDDPVAALELGEQILNVVESQLSEHPYSGRPGRVEGTRELIVHPSYLVVYSFQRVSIS